jgi:large subunit ribosomal protein L4
VQVNKKMKRVALRGALTDALQSGKLAVVDDLSFEEPRTRDAVGVLEALGLRGRILLVLPAPENLVERSFRNLPYVKVAFARSLSVYDLLAADRVLLTKAAVDMLEQVGRGSSPADSEAGTSPAPRRVAKEPEAAAERSNGSEEES